MSQSLLNSASEKKTKNKGLEYYRKWNLQDFAGKYHVNSFAQKDCPVPGTQVMDEIKHIKAKKGDLDALETFVKETDEACTTRTRIRKELAKVSTRVIFKTTIGDPIERLTAIQSCKAKSLKEGAVNAGSDSPESIAVRKL